MPKGEKATFRPNPISPGQPSASWQERTLKAILTGRGLETTGSKQELLQRLTAACKDKPLRLPSTSGSGKEYGAVEAWQPFGYPRQSLASISSLLSTMHVLSSKMHGWSHRLNSAFVRAWTAMSGGGAPQA